MAGASGLEAPVFLADYNSSKIELRGKKKIQKKKNQQIFYKLEILLFQSTWLKAQAVHTQSTRQSPQESKAGTEALDCQTSFSRQLDTCLVSVL